MKVHSSLPLLSALALMAGAMTSLFRQKPNEQEAQKASSTQRNQTEKRYEKDIANAQAAMRNHVLEQILNDKALFERLPQEHRERLAHYAKYLAEKPAEMRLCLAPGTPEDIVRSYGRVEQRMRAASSIAPLPALQQDARWTSTATNPSGVSTQGTPVTLRWSIVPDGTPVSAGGSITGESSDASNLRARLNTIYSVTNPSGAPSTQPWFAVFQATFDNLAANTGLRFVYEPNDDGAAISGLSSPGAVGVRGDMRISGHRIDGNSGVLAYNYFPNNGDMVIDTDDSFFTNITNNSIRLRNVLEHEFGHGLGLDHVCPINQTKLMEPFITTSFRGSQFDDIYSHQRQYGDPLEVHSTFNNNDATARATPLTLTAGTTFGQQWLSIDDNSDTDFFRISATSGQRLTVRVIPSDPISPGTTPNTYLEGAQNDDGTCSAGTAFDPTTRKNLNLALLASNGTTVLSSAPAQPAGTAEIISSFVITTTGNHFIRVNAGTEDTAQLYRLEVLLENSTPATVTLSNLTRTFTGSPLPITVTTAPTGLTTSVTYNASATVPSNIGTYSVVATITSSGFTGSNTGTYNIISPYTAWINGFASIPAGQRLTTIDADNDGWTNGAEFAFGSVPNSPSSRPQLQNVLTPTTFQLTYPTPPPFGVTFTGQTSTDLNIWSSTGVSTIVNGYEIPRTDAKRFLRIFYSIQ